MSTKVIKRLAVVLVAAAALVAGSSAAAHANGWQRAAGDPVTVGLHGNGWQIAPVTPDLAKPQNGWQ